jgi:hypothetical protein
MATTFVKIQTVTVGTAVATIDFTSIPQTYTDLKLVVSARSTTSINYLEIRFNGASTNLSGKYLQGDGTNVGSSPFQPFLYISPSTATASVFSNGEIYIPNYTSANYKSVAADGVFENNATLSYQALQAGLWSSTDAINQVSLVCTGVAQTFAQYTTATLYGIKSS